MVIMTFLSLMEQTEALDYEPETKLLLCGGGDGGFEVQGSAFGSGWYVAQLLPGSNPWVTRVVLLLYC